MDKETLSNYGWIVICVLILAVMLALATPFGSFIKVAIQSTTNALFDTNQNALNSTGLINMPDQTLGDQASCGIKGHTTNDGKQHGIPVSECYGGHTYTCECTPTKMLSYGVYYRGVNTTAVGDYSSATHIYYENDDMPNCYTPQTGDVFVYNGYEYRYNYRYWYNTSAEGWEQYNIDSWSVITTDKTKAEYPEILPQIFEKPITHMVATFRGCENLTMSPQIPNTVTNMSGTFCYCYSLEYAPKIPEKLIEMGDTFAWCISIKSIPAIPETVNNLFHTFVHCKKINGTLIAHCKEVKSFEQCIYGTEITKIEGSAPQHIKDAIMESKTKI